MGAAALAVLIALLWRFPDWVASRLWTAHIAVPLAGRLNRLDRRHVLFMLMLIVVLLAAGEVLAALGPLDMGLVLLWDVASYVDALAATALVASVVRLRPLRMLVSTTLARAHPRRRRRKTRHRPGRTGAANDDDDPALTVAA